MLTCVDSLGVMDAMHQYTCVSQINTGTKVNTACLTESQGKHMFT